MDGLRRPSLFELAAEYVDGRDKPGHDDEGSVTPGNSLDCVRPLGSGQNGISSSRSPPLGASQEGPDFGAAPVVGRDAGGRSRL